MISYSLHLSNKKHALTTTKKVAAASKHNLRQYESPQYCRDNIFVLVGGDNILDDLKEAYHQEFDACLEEYNKGKRAGRQIDDYLKYVSESGKNDVAAELVIQLGDAELNDKSFEMKKQMLPIFEDQLKHLQELVPDFRLDGDTSAVCRSRQQRQELSPKKVSQSFRTRCISTPNGK